MYDQLIRTKLNSEQKRGAAGFALSMFGSILGFMGAKIINSVSGTSDEEKTSELLENQISVLKLANSQMNEMQNISKKAEDMQWDMSYMLLALIRFQKEQKLILNAISNEQTELKADWIRPDELMAQINIITGHLPDHLHWIGKNEREQMLAVYQLAKKNIFHKTNNRFYY